MNILIGILITFGLYALYGIGVLHGQRHEQKKRKRELQQIANLSKDTKSKTNTYQFNRADGYELFQINNN